MLFQGEDHRVVLGARGETPGVGPEDYGGGVGDDIRKGERWVGE